MSEENKCEYGDIKDYKSAFECFVQRFLVEKKSIFDLNTDCNDSDKCCVLTPGSVKYLIDNFINDGFGGKASFIEKIKFQLITDPQNKYDKSDNELKLLQEKSLVVLAHIIWLWRLVPSNAKMSSTRISLQEILNLANNNKLKINENNPFLSKSIEGIAGVGTYYNTNKPFELAYVIQLINQLISNESSDAIDILNNTLKGVVKISGEYDLVYNTSNKKYERQKDQNCSKDGVTKSASIHHALLHFFKPENYEPIVSNNHKKSIIKALYKDNDNGKNDDEKIKKIKESLCNKFSESEKSTKCNKLHFFYMDEIKEQWNPSILPAKNVIYYGAPGTGKTHDLLKIVRSKVSAQCKNNECLEHYYEIVQFHPSYSYEDFIDGIKPVKSTSNINLELVDGVFKNMCKRAYEELKTNPDNPKNFYFIADEINRAELSRVFGELLLCIEEDKRLKFKDGVLEGVKIKTQNSNLWEEKNAVVVIDNTKCNQDNGLYFGVPENIYFLATMNDIDKSIDSFDLALRRRFKWVHKGCDYDVIYNKLLTQDINDDDIDSYVTDEKEGKGRCNLLNRYIRETLNLGSSYELGHSYFMNIKVHGGKIPKNAFENLFDQELAPLLSEYLRSEISDSKELKDKLACMKKIFTKGEKCK